MTLIRLVVISVVTWTGTCRLAAQSATEAPPDAPPEVTTRDGETVRWAWLPSHKERGDRAKVGGVPPFREGGHYLRTARFLAAWNFNDAIRRDHVGKPPKIPVAMIDMGFGEHREVGFEWPPPSTENGYPFLRVHGSFCAGIIAARADDGLGIQGCTPFAGLYPLALESPVEKGGDLSKHVAAHCGTLKVDLLRAINEVPGLKVVYVAPGYNLARFGVNVSDSEFREVVRREAKLIDPLLELYEKRGVIIVCVAGNDSAGVPIPINAAWSNSLNYLALVGGPDRGGRKNVVVVESVNAKGERSRFSNAHGNISAPGELILGASVVSPTYEPSKTSYTVISGSSLAAAQVSALIAHMYAYAPELSAERVLDILDVRASNRPARRSPAPQLDAFDAMLRCRERSLKDLADLNADGRVDRLDFDRLAVAIRREESRASEDKGKETPPSGPLAVAEAASPWPREDLNGDGVVSRSNIATLWHPVDRLYVSLTDLQVMMEAWDDQELSREKLPELLDSYVPDR